jgi:magnesium-transporting ATPase (P-type)
MCFDKTGTLTEDKVEVNSIYKFEDFSYREITGKGQEEKGLDFKIFGSCHTVREFDN